MSFIFFFNVDLLLQKAFRQWRVARSLRILWLKYEITCSSPISSEDHKGSCHVSQEQVMKECKLSGQIVGFQPKCFETGSSRSHCNLLCTETQPYTQCLLRTLVLQPGLRSYKGADLKSIFSPTCCQRRELFISGLMAGFTSNPQLWAFLSFFFFFWWC